ncbi:tectonin domain-containing protein [Streptomyces bobili]|uniref:tectonin domain-containing protein n=1 Tax=Streptomyces bobili TaxID=67280 RepID=UPI0038154013
MREKSIVTSRTKLIGARKSVLALSIAVLASIALEVPNVAAASGIQSSISLVESGARQPQPAMARDVDGRLNMFATDAADNVWSRWQLTPGSSEWSAWSRFEGKRLRNVTAEANADGRIEVLGTNGAGQIFHRWQLAGGGWSSWAQLEGTLKSVALARNKDGRLEVFGANLDGVPWHAAQTTAGSSSWSPWSAFDGEVRTVAAQANADGRIELFALNGAGEIFHRWQLPGGGWSAWDQLEGSLESITLASNEDGRLELFGTNQDGRMWHASQNLPGSADWSSWSPFDDGLFAAVAAEAEADGDIELAAVNADGATYHRVHDSGWSPWAPLSGNLAAHSSDVANWLQTHRIEYEGEVWSEEAQGITTDGTNWYVTSNNSDDRRLYKFGPNFPKGDKRILASIRMPSTAGNHLGPPVYDPTRGKIAIAVEPGNVWVVNGATMRTDTLAPLGGPGGSRQGKSIPWVSFSPTDGLLYSSVFGRSDQTVPTVDRINVYDPSNEFRFVRSIFLEKSLTEVQGGHVSPSGRLYLTSNSFSIHGFDLEDGSYLGSKPVSKSGVDEIEGLTLGDPYVWGTDVTQAAVLSLDNNTFARDDVVITFYSVANPEVM